MAYVLEELERRELEVDRTGQFLIALYEACTRHVRRGEWDYELDQLPLNKHHETGEPATVPFLVAAEINDPASRAEYAEERWAKVHRRFYGDE